MYRQTTTFATAPPVIQHPVVVLQPPGVGPQMLWCCCDMCVAMIAVNVIIIIGTIVGGLYYADAGSAVVLMVIALVVCFALGIFGAASFNKWLVGIALVADTFNDACSVLFGFYFVIVLWALFPYPHVVFISEASKGVMTKENYVNVRSC
jgi:hypothetical protein